MTEISIAGAGTYPKSRKALFLLSFLSSLVAGTVSTLMSVYLPDAVKELLSNTSARDTENIGATINAIFIFGWTAGGIAWGILSDSLGRRKSFVFATFCYGLFTVLTGFAPSWILIVLCRFVSGFGIGGVLVTTTMLVSEGYEEKRREVLLGILSISIPLGIFSAGLLTYLVPQWRLAFAVGILPIVLSLISWNSVPESQKWARAPKPETGANLRALFGKENRKNLLTGSAIFGAALIGLWATFSWLPTWIESLAAGMNGQKDRGIGMMMMGGGGLIGGFVSGWAVHGIGLRKTLLACFAASFALSFFLFRLTTGLTVLAYFEIALITFFFGMSQGALSMYVPALFPTSLSATATGVCFNLGRIFTGVAVFFIGALVSTLGGYGNAIFCFSFVFLVALSIILFSRKADFSS